MIINSERASRWYGQVIGLNDVSCQIGVGITALLGQNGAGKSTFIKLITGQLKPTTGRVSVMNENPFANPNVLKRMGYVPETDSFYESMTGFQFVSLMGRMSGIPSRDVKSRTDEVIEAVGMTARAHSKIASYSKGMRQRIKLAQALIHDPEVLILDEPLNGLDPVGRKNLSDLLRRLAEGGKTIVISSHILYEVEQLTKNILLLHRGRLLAQGDIHEIRSLIDKHPHRIRINMENPRSIGTDLVSHPSVLSLQFDRIDPSLIDVQTNDPDSFYSYFGEIILTKGCKVESFFSPDNNLEAVFNYLLER